MQPSSISQIDKQYYTNLVFIQSTRSLKCYAMKTKNRYSLTLLFIFMLVCQNVTHKKLHVAKCVRHNTSFGRIRVSVSVTVTPVTGSVNIGYRAGLYPVVAYILSEHEDEYTVQTSLTKLFVLPYS